MAAQAVGGAPTYGRIVRAALTADEMAAPVNFDIALKLRNREELEACVNGGKIFSRTELEAYLPTAADYSKVRAWLVAQGFEITLDADCRHAIFARGSNTQAATAFSVQLGRVETADGEFTSAVTAPSLPDEIASVVAGIRGLQPHLIRHPHSRSGQWLVANGFPAITPEAVATVYQVPYGGGAGQTIAVISDSIPNTNDLWLFWMQCGIFRSDTDVSVANVQGGPGTDTTNQFEASLDVEWASGLAPSAQIRIYAVPYPLGPSSEAAAYTQILNDLPANPTVHQVTESYGGIEADNGGGDSSLLLLVAQGVTCFAASDDGGSNPDPGTGYYNSHAPLSVSYPASDPSMTGVGGTTLIFPQSLAGQCSPPEVAWSLTTNQGVTSASGGGISGVFSRPTWQVAPGMPAGSQRCVPDVAAVAYTGNASDDMGPLVYYGISAYAVAGTSLSSPIWAGLCALINESRAYANLAPVGFLNPKLYAAAGTSCFTDIASGNNGAYSAGVGYDMCTGLGTPLVGNLITYLSTINQAPWIYSQPADAAVQFGQSAQFVFTVGGYPRLALQWQVSTDGGVSWSNLTDTQTYVGTATGTLTIVGGTVAMNGNEYRCVATNSIGSATSAVVTLTVNGQPIYTTQPANQTTSVGGRASFTVAATGNPTPTYQWQFSADGGNTWTSLTDTASYSGATYGTLTVSWITAAMNGYQYRCLASNSSASDVASGAAVLTVSSPSGCLWAMGYNYSGELGNGTRLNYQYVPLEILPGGIQSVATGSSSLIVKTDGSLWAMGLNDNGELGDGTTNDSYFPEEILSAGVQSVSVGGGFSLVVKTDGSLWGMGLNSTGQLGDGTTTRRLTPERILANGVKSVAASGQFSLVVKTDGSLWAMGDNDSGQLGDGTTNTRYSPVEIVTGGVQSVAAGGRFGLIVKTDGSLWGTGDNYYGQLGDGTTTQRNGPVEILSSGVQAVAAGADFSLILKTDGSLWATGNNYYGQFGDGTTTPRDLPETVMSGGVQAIAAGSGDSLILKTDGSLWAVGSNLYGQLGDGGATNGRFTPELVAVNVQSMAASMDTMIVGSNQIVIAPTFTTQPAGQTVTAGSIASFAVTVSGIPASTFQWQVSGDGGNTWTNLTNYPPYGGTTTGTLAVTDVTTQLNGDQYRCVATNTAGSGRSLAATLTVMGLSDQAFLQRLYLDVMGRAIDPVAQTAYDAALAGGMPRADVLGELLGSAEYSAWQVEPVIRLYYAALARPPDYTGLRNWSNALHAGALTLAGAGDQFAGSAEFLQDYGSLDNTAFVQQLYFNVLGRQADPAGLADWVNQLNSGSSRGKVLIGFSESPEFQADTANQVEIVRLYDLLLHRMPTAAELQTWRNFGQGDAQTDTLFSLGCPAGLDPADEVQLIFQGFLRRPVDETALSTFGSALTAGTVSRGSLVNTLLTSTEFNSLVAPVSRLYMAAFRRVPDVGGLDNWVAYVRAGNTLQSAADAFVASQEFQLTYGSLNDTQYVTLLYENVLGREPDPNGLQDWVNQLGAGATRGQVLIGFSESPEGIALFAPTVRTFLHYFTFLGTTPAPADLDFWKNYLATLDDQMRTDLLADPTFANGS
jgi:alpha-tubulin suppressor-like RCC1 family protein